MQITDANDECACAVGRDYPCNPSNEPARCSIFTNDFDGNTLKNAGICFIALIGDGPPHGSGDATALAAQIGVASATVDPAGKPSRDILKLKLK